MKKKIRILYLINHVTLSKFEIPMLLDMGYEVYMPKIPPFDISVRVDMELDKVLTVPMEEVSILNDTNFYDEPLNETCINIINQYFDIAFVTFCPEALKSIMSRFNGVICFRAFGTNITYTELFTNYFTDAEYSLIQKLGNRFWFGAGYKSIIESEGKLLKGRSLFMPLGLPNAKIDDRWIGGGKRVLFSCPKIKTEAYFNQAYTTFKNDFKNIPYVISGLQPIPVNEDPNVLGYLQKEEYDNIFITSSCMYYYSKYKTHIHYTPAEAICYGLPLLYLSGGLLDTIGGENLAGRCKSIKEVINKAQRLIDDDKKLAERIRQDQTDLLEVFSKDYCHRYWVKAMNTLEGYVPNRIKQSTCKRSKRIGIILPSNERNDFWEFSILFIKALVWGAKALNDNVEFIFSYTETPDIESYLSELKELGIPTRTFYWEKLTPQQLDTYRTLLGINEQGNTILNDRFTVNDGYGYFRDCDFLIFTSDLIPGDCFIPIPYAAILHGFPQRLMPNILSTEVDNSKLRFIRSSSFQLTMLPITKNHAVQYALLSKEHIHVIPFLVKNIEKDFCCLENSINIPGPYIFWYISSALYIDHKSTMKALKKYYLNGGKLKCYLMLDNVVGSSCNYYKEIKIQIKNDVLLRKNIVYQFKKSNEMFFQIINKACAVIEPNVLDDYDLTCYYAKYFGMPVLASECPALKYIDNYFNLNLEFFEPDDEDSLSNKLLAIEKGMLGRSELYKNCEPTRESLKQFCVSNYSIYSKIYKIVKFKIGI